MSKDKLIDHPNDVVVVASLKTRRAKPSVAKTRAAGDPQLDDRPGSIDARPAMSSSSEVTGRSHRQDFRGRPPQRKDHVLQVCRILRTALNDHGDTWGSFSEPQPPANDIVAAATDKGGKLLRVQVSRVDRAAAKTMARGDPVIRRRSVGQRVADILAAMDSQARRHPATMDNEMLLALDAIRSPEHLERGVVDAFLAAHQNYAAGLGYREIWLVGPTGEMSYRLS
jgi:hypothetical protein